MFCNFFALVFIDPETSETDRQVETLLIPTSRLDSTAMARAEIEDRGQPVVSTSNMWTNQYNQHLTLNNFTLHS